MDQDGNHQGRIEGETGIFLRPLMSPIPLACFAFGVGSFLQSVLRLGWVSKGKVGDVAPLLGAFVFLARETMGVTVLGLFSFAWLGSAPVVHTAAPDLTSGHAGLLIAQNSLYGGVAFAAEDVEHRAVLPLGRRGEAARAFEGGLGEQVGPLKTEAGVREQL